jgi:hypothetical protein
MNDVVTVTTLFYLDVMRGSMAEMEMELGPCLGSLFLTQLKASINRIAYNLEHRDIP